MSIRKLIVTIEITKDFNVTAFCRAHDVSSWFFYDLRRRYALEGDAALTPQSRAPHRTPNKTAVHVEDAIVAKHKELEGRGLDAGAGSVWGELEGLEGLPSEKTVYRILARRGFVVVSPQKAPNKAAKGRRFQAERANQRWGIDDTGWRLADQSSVKILNAIDDRSRLWVVSKAMTSWTGAASLNAAADAAGLLGWPATFLSDQAPGFCSMMASAVAELGVHWTTTRPYHPQTNGKVERLHQTMKKWLAAQTPAETIDELQDQLDLFRLYYNHQRRHRAIGRRVPADVWMEAPKDGPANRPLNATTEHHQRTVVSGRVELPGRRLIAIGSSFDGQQALVATTGNDCHIFIDGRLVRALTIDPTRKYQPLHDRPGRPRLP